jgi:hypothetical protein
MIMKTKYEALKRKSLEERETLLASNDVLKRKLLEQREILMASNDALKRKSLEQREILMASNDALKRKSLEQREILMASNDVLKRKLLEQREILMASNDALKRKLLSPAEQIFVRNLFAFSNANESLLSFDGTDWNKRWEDSNRKKILMFARKDYAGSFYNWTAAINRHTEYAARMVTMQPHPYGYPQDIICTGQIDKNWNGLNRLLNEADLIHLKDETGFFDGSNKIPGHLFDELKGKTPIIYTAYGGMLRQNQNNKNFIDYLHTYDARICMTPDLNSPQFDGWFIPHAIDTQKYPVTWEANNVVCHTPSTRSRKGTSNFLLAMQEVQSKINNVTLDLVENVSHDECVKRKQRSSLFFDQAGRESLERLGTDAVIGWYGNSALECAVAGIPTIAHLSETAFDGAERAGVNIREKCAILNTGLDDKAIFNTIKNYFNLTAEEQVKLSKNTRKFVEDFHSFEATASALNECYESLL